MKRIISVSFILVALSLGLTGCAPDRDSSVEYAREWFDVHQHEAREILDILGEHPAIARVREEASEPERIPGSENFSEADWQAYDHLMAMKEALDIIAIVYATPPDSDRMISMDMVLISWGIVNAGYAVSVYYLPDKAFAKRLKAYDVVLHPLPVENWYVRESL